MTVRMGIFAEFLTNFGNGELINTLRVNSPFWKVLSAFELRVMTKRKIEVLISCAYLNATNPVVILLRTQFRVVPMKIRDPQII